MGLFVGVFLGIIVRRGPCSGPNYRGRPLFGTYWIAESEAESFRTPPPIHLIMVQGQGELQQLGVLLQSPEQVFYGHFMGHLDWLQLLFWHGFLVGF